MFWWDALLDNINWNIVELGVTHCLLWIQLTAVPYQISSGPLSCIRGFHKGCYSSMYHPFIYEVSGSGYIVLYVTLHPFGGLSLLHSQSIGPKWGSMYILVVVDIYLLCGWTTGPHQASLCPVDFFRLPLLFKNNKGPP